LKKKATLDRKQGKRVILSFRMKYTVFFLSAAIKSQIKSINGDGNERVGNLNYYKIFVSNQRHEIDAQIKSRAAT
jgi:hypothetical protein